MVAPQVLESTENIISVPLEKRHCRFVSESGNLDMFKDYGFKSCIFECMYKHAKDFCSCVPWNYPTFGNGSDTCDIMGNYCFLHQLKNGSNFDTCNCPNECNKVSYTYYTNLQKLEPSDCVRPIQDKEKRTVRFQLFSLK